MRRELAERIGNLPGWPGEFTGRRPRIVGRLSRVAAGSYEGFEVDLWRSLDENRETCHKECRRLPDYGSEVIKLGDEPPVSNGSTGVAQVFRWLNHPGWAGKPLVLGFRVAEPPNING
ncbi:hypothetical protein BHM03_00038445 [Ensete ventricosum]|nr:hypothetical protein BHM03_00038445 [Ensete ventricosum]